MESRLYLDTHVLAWLYAGMIERLGPQAQESLESSFLLVSPMVRVELDYLCEIGRTRRPGGEVIADLQTRLMLDYGTTPFLRVALASQQVAWTRDPFDRLIAAQAIADDRPLLTADRKMLEYLPSARDPSS